MTASHRSGPPWVQSLVYAGRGARNALIDLRHGRPLNGRWRRPGGKREPHTNSDHLALARIFEGRVRPDDVLVDIGCGRGRVLNHWLTHHPGHRIVGLELDDEVARSTAHRLRKYPNCQVLAGDAVANLPADGTLFYLYNPFGPDDVARLSHRLLEIAQNAPSPLVVLYHNPKHVGVFEQTSAWSVGVQPIGGTRWAPFDDLAVIRPET